MEECVKRFATGDSNVEIAGSIGRLSQADTTTDVVSVEQGAVNHESRNCCR